MADGYDVTSVGKSPTEDRAHRMKVYFIAMTVRVVCVASLFFVEGWWLLIVGIAAVVLPYFAVLVANQAAHNPGVAHESPTPLELESQEVAEERDPAEPASAATIVVDAPAERRSTGEPT